MPRHSSMPSSVRWWRTDSAAASPTDQC